MDEDTMIEKRMLNHQGQSVLATGGRERRLVTRQNDKLNTKANQQRRGRDEWHYKSILPCERMAKRLHREEEVSKATYHFE